MLILVSDIGSITDASMTVNRLLSHCPFTICQCLSSNLLVCSIFVDLRHEPSWIWSKHSNWQPTDSDDINSVVNILCFLTTAKQNLPGKSWFSHCCSDRDDLFDPSSTTILAFNNFLLPTRAVEVG